MRRGVGSGLGKMVCLCCCSLEEKKQPIWGGGSDLHPLPSVTSSLGAPGARQPGLAQRGQAGVVGGSFQLPLCLGKIPFHVAACDLSRRFCRRGASSREWGEALLPGAPSSSTPHPRTRQTAAPLGPAMGREGLPGGRLGVKPGQQGAPRQEAPACPHPASGSTQAADGLGQPSLACLQVWGGRLQCQPGGGCCDSASLDLFSVPAHSPAMAPGPTSQHASPKVEAPHPLHFGLCLRKWEAIPSVWRWGWLWAEHMMRP